MTMVKIATVEVGAGGAASIDFTSIPQIYTDLMLVASVRESSTNNFTVELRLNSSTTSYSSRILQGSGSAVTSSAPADLAFIDAGNGATASTFGNSQTYIPNYTGSAFKAISTDSVSENNATLSFQRLTAGLWSNTSAITSVSIVGNIAQYSSATLYGITKGNGLATVS